MDKRVVAEKSKPTNKIPQHPVASCLPMQSKRIIPLFYRLLNTHCSSAIAQQIYGTSQVIRPEVCFPVGEGIRSELCEG